jgi:hypothetical protein
LAVAAYYLLATGTHLFSIARTTAGPPVRARSLVEAIALGAAAAGIVQALSLLEIRSGGIGPLLAAFVFAEAGIPVAGAIAVAALWYGAEAALARRAGWHLSLRSPLAWMPRDLLLPVLWTGGWVGRDFVWRGNQMRAVEQRGAI